jgi:hypothetical protein
VKFDKDAKSSKSQEPLAELKKVAKLTAPKAYPQIPGKSELD